MRVTGTMGGREGASGVQRADAGRGEGGDHLSERRGRSGASDRRGSGSGSSRRSSSSSSKGGSSSTASSVRAESQLRTGLPSKSMSAATHLQR